MDILAGEKRRAHRLVARDVREQAQLDLRIVRVHEHVAGRGDKHFAQSRPQLAPDGNILQIRLGGRETSRRRDGHLEIGMDASVRADDLQKAVRVGGFELGELAVFEHMAHDGLIAELIEHIGIGAPAGLGLFPAGETELFKKHGAELFRGLDVEFLPRLCPNRFAQRVDAARKTLAEGAQRLRVGKEALVFHFGKHCAERQLDLCKKLLHLRLAQLREHNFLERRDARRARGPSRRAGRRAFFPSPPERSSMS